MKEVYVVKIKNDVNGISRYAVDLQHYPECGEIGKAKRGKNWVRIFQSQNVERTLQDYFNEKIEVKVLSV